MRLTDFDLLRHRLSNYRRASSWQARRYSAEIKVLSVILLSYLIRNDNLDLERSPLKYYSTNQNASKLYELRSSRDYKADIHRRDDNGG